MTVLFHYSSLSMVKALPQNSKAIGFASITPTIIRPDYAYGQILPQNTTGVQLAAPGYFTAGHMGWEAPGRLKLMPYCEDTPGAKFSLRLYAWHPVVNPDATGEIWFPQLLVELACTAGSLAGIKGRWVKDTEFMADTITLTSGNLGPWYSAIYTPTPGIGLGAFALVDLTGARFFSFDFQAFDPVAGTGMNCLWCRA